MRRALTLALRVRPDPAGLSKEVTPEGLAWYRACELKHGRVAMMACGGFIVQGAGVHFPG